MACDVCEDGYEWNKDGYCNYIPILNCVGLESEQKCKACK